jgi:hypothetical protein
MAAAFDSTTSSTVSMALTLRDCNKTPTGIAARHDPPPAACMNMRCGHVPRERQGETLAATAEEAVADADIITTPNGITRD